MFSWSKACNRLGFGDRYLTKERFFFDQLFKLETKKHSNGNYAWTFCIDEYEH